MIACLFAHTKQGEAALAELMEAGVAHSAVQVVGDLGSAGTERHVTLDALRVPADLRALFMDTVRMGGVVLGVVDGAVSDKFVTGVAERHGALRVASGAAVNASHEVA